ncbi:MAG: 50S ribosomal protein L4 [Patescibacteria group bacterium]|jgi:large subunit ribosomal protein L4
MAKVDIYTKEGKKTDVMELPDALFAVPMKKELVHEAIVIQDENSRVRLAHTKDRSEVSGGGKKPWRQKGTGRARHGSSRSPIWIGGGVTFGPTVKRVFGKKINKAAKRKALAMVLSDRLASEQFFGIEDYGFSNAKTKEVALLRKVLPGAGKSTVFLTTPKDISVIRAVKNLPKTNTLCAGSLNVRDLVKYQYIIASKDAINVLTQCYER